MRYAQSKGLNLKVSDEFTVPLCAIHHHHIHTTGKEREWWQERNIDPLIVASDLWQQSSERYPANSLQEVPPNGGNRRQNCHQASDTPVVAPGTSDPTDSANLNT